MLFTFSICIRRWHDMNKSGNFVFLNIIANYIYILQIFLIPYMLIKKGTDGANKYGPDLTKLEE